MEYMESSSELSIEQWEQALRPIQNIYPPNQIIKKNYDPDIKPTFVLLRKEQKNKKQKQILSSISKHSYCQNFEDEDTLGYWYSKLIQENLIYMKFNNQKFMRCPSTNRNYLAGLFIPLDHLLKPQVRTNKNVYKTLAEIQFTQYKYSIDDSFNKNSFCQQPQIKFSSNYQSSNLFIAVKKKQLQYDLILQNDINSKGSTQWFNFAVSIYSQGKYKFNIVNLTKSCSLYQKGMKICYFSYQNKAVNKKGWMKGCTNINYFKNAITRQANNESNYYTLQFQYESPFKYDTIIFSYCYPYTFIDMQKFFTKVIYKKMSSTFKIQKIKLCQSLSGHPIYIYEISPKKAQTMKKIMSTNLFTLTSQNNFIKKDQIASSKAIVFMSRQHSGQTQGSFITQGIVQFLLQNNQYQGYKKSYTFYIIPMINVDGVYYGNYRTNLSGTDLNRIWRYPRKDFNSQIFYTKRFLASMNKITPISLIIDIHGHSTSLNSFFYGNPSKKQQISYNSQNSKLFPYFCSKRIKQISFSQSTFLISQDKKNSARVVLNQMFPKALVYTFQNSFYGSKKGRQIQQYTIDTLKRIGKDLIISYLQYQKITERNSSIKQKWQGQIQILSAKSKKGNQQIVSESDSQAGNQLIGFQNQLQNIQQVQFNTNRCFVQDKVAKIPKNTQLYNSKRSTTGTKLKKRTSLSPPVKASQIQNDTTIQQVVNQFSYKRQGFLSIVKIDTKQSSINNNLNTLNQKRNKLLSSSNSSNNLQRQRKFNNFERKTQSTKENEKANPFFKLVREYDYLKQQKQDYLMNKTVNFQRSKVKSYLKGCVMQIQKKF